MPKLEVDGVGLQVAHQGDLRACLLQMKSIGVRSRDADEFPPQLPTIKLAGGDSARRLVVGVYCYQ